MEVALRPAVFLDRDDTLIDNRGVTADTPFPGDLIEPGLVRLLPGVAEGLHGLGSDGFVLVVVSNQGAVARGRCGLARVEACHRRLRECVQAASGARIEAFYACPYHPTGTREPWVREHPWRKPSAGMLLAASADLGLDLGRSWLIGDAERDADAAVAAGIARDRALIVGESGLDFGAAVARILDSNE